MCSQPRSVLVLRLFIPVFLVERSIPSWLLKVKGGKIITGMYVEKAVVYFLNKKFYIHCGFKGGNVQISFLFNFQVAFEDYLGE